MVFAAGRGRAGDGSLCKHEAVIIRQEVPGALDHTILARAAWADDEKKSALPDVRRRLQIHGYPKRSANSPVDGAGVSKRAMTPERQILIGFVTVPRCCAVAIAGFR